MFAVFGCVSPPVAGAATLRQNDHSLIFADSGGEANDVRFDWSGSTITIEDRSAVISPAPGLAGVCTFGQAGHVAVCPNRWEKSINTFELGEGDDRITGLPWRAAGRIEVSAGGGDDVVEAAPPLSRAPVDPSTGFVDPGVGVVVKGGDGDDVLSGLQAFGEGGDDLITWSVGGLGGFGDDVVHGDEFASGGPGSDRIYSAGTGWGDGSWEDEGNDTIYAAEHAFGGGGDDFIVGDTGPVWGGGGHDTIRAASSASSFDMYGDVGTDDLLHIGTGDADGGDGNDHVATTAGSARGGSDDDEVLLLGGSGVARLGAPQAGETCAGARVGDDLAAPRSIADGEYGNDVVTGGSAADVLIGGSGDDRLTGGGGDDSLIDEGGNDHLVGGDGSDSLNGGAGADVIDGGAGARDVVCYADHSAGVTVDLRTAGGDGMAGEGDNVLVGVEWIGGSRFADRIFLGTQPATVRAGDGDDVVVGSPGDDDVEGGFDSDSIIGGPGNDRLHGGEETVIGRPNSNGADVIDGGEGDDWVAGDRGNDRLSGGSGSDTLASREVLAEPTLVLNHSPILSLAHEDALSCGKGIDEVLADYADAIAGDCESGSEGTPRWRRQRVDRDGHFDLKIRCAWVAPSPCKGVATVVVARPGRFAASRAVTPATGAPSWCKGTRTSSSSKRRFAIRAGRVGTIEIKLGPSLNRLLKQRGCIPVRVITTLGGPPGLEHEASRTVTLLAPKFRPSAMTP